ncbi:unnamed protein product [Urochloa decumbens]|uniref:WAT1-related protein n=1 Tax=Urochloa decumbens TaxID=240449 RepID=A0ABC9EWK2_9POAL
MAMEDYKPCAAMVVTQCIYAAMALWSKAVFSGGMSPLVFVVYRQAVATVVLVPVVVVANRKKMKEMVGLGVVGFSLVFVASLVGATVNQCLYYQGVNLGSSSMATAMTNLIPAITFVMAASVGLEKVEVRRPRSLAKIFGTAVCVSGAMSMAFFKGPKLLGGLHALLLRSPEGGISRWVVGALFLIGSSSCWSLWLILQVPICKSYVDPLSLSAWMCLLSTLQSALLVSFLQPDPAAWRIHSLFEISCCLFSGVFGSGVTFYLQSWSISVRGPLYSAMFNPLNTVLTTVIAAVVLREELHVGRCVCLCLGVCPEITLKIVNLQVHFCTGWSSDSSSLIYLCSFHSACLGRSPSSRDCTSCCGERRATEEARKGGSWRRNTRTIWRRR